MAEEIDLAGLLRPGDRLAWSAGPMEPTDLLAVLDRANRVPRVSALLNLADRASGRRPKPFPGSDIRQVDAIDAIEPVAHLADEGSYALPCAGRDHLFSLSKVIGRSLTRFPVA